MTFVAGAYTATWNAASIGATENGFTVENENHIQPITIDEFGDSIVDGVNQGTSVTVRLDFVEYTLIKVAMTASHVIGAPKTNVGKTMVSLAQPLVLTPVAGTPAATDGGTWTFHKCVVEGNVDVLLSSKHRKGPITFRCYPDSGNSNKTYTVAAGS